MTHSDDDRYTWVEDTFLSQGTACAVRVYRPADAGPATVPVIVMAHGFGAVRALRLYGEFLDVQQRLQAAGGGCVGLHTW